MIPQYQKRLMNFKALSGFTGNNPDFEKQLLDALAADLTGFKFLVLEKPDRQQFDQFRRGVHNITPSLQMLEIHDLIHLIETYKTVYYEKGESVADIASEILELLDQVLQGITGRLSSEKNDN